MLRQILVQVGGLARLALAEQIFGKPHIRPYRGHSSQINHTGSECKKQYRHAHKAEQLTPERRFGAGRSGLGWPVIVRPMIYGHGIAPFQQMPAPTPASERKTVNSEQLYIIGQKTFINRKNKES